MASQRKHLSFDQALARIHADALKAATAHIDIEDIPDALSIPDGPWTPKERSTLEARRAYCIKAVETYHDHPKPFGPYATDPEAWDRYVADGVATGTVRHRLMEVPRPIRDLLQYSRRAGSAVLLPHLAPGDDTPRHLRLEYLMRRFAVDASTADDLANFFDQIEADRHTVDHYAHRAKQQGFSSIWLELRHWAQLMMELEPSSEDVLEQDDLQPYYDDNPDPASALDEADFEDPELADGFDRARTPGFSAEAWHYHRTGHGDCEPADPLDHDPLLEHIRSTKPYEIAPLKKEMFELQKRNGHDRTVAQWGYLWNLITARENDLARNSQHLTRALRQLEVARDSRQIARLGREAFAASKRWASFERKRFWAKYNRKKAELAPATAA